MFPCSTGSVILIRRNQPGYETAGSELNFKTLKVEPNKVVPDPVLQCSDFTDEAMSPSGLKVRNASTGRWIRAMDQNEHLIHVRINGSELLATDKLVHKATHEKDDDGAFVVTSAAFPYYSGQLGLSDDMDKKVSLVSLLSSGGAIVVTSPGEEPHNQYLAYVEPLPGLPAVFLCSVPLGKGFRKDYDDVDCRFYVCYNGFLYVYFEGRFLKLWVDLGRRTVLNIDDK